MSVIFDVSHISSTLAFQLAPIVLERMKASLFVGIDERIIVRRVGGCLPWRWCGLDNLIVVLRKKVGTTRQNEWLTTAVAPKFHRLIHVVNHDSFK